MNVVTKSGTNDWKGSAFAYYRPSDWTADRADGVPPREAEKVNLGASFGGPVIRDRLFFFASYEQQRQDTTYPIDEVVRTQRGDPQRELAGLPPHVGRGLRPDAGRGRLLRPARLPG